LQHGKPSARLAGREHDGRMQYEIPPLDPWAVLVVTPSGKKN